MWCLRRRPVTDEEHVQRLRRLVAFMDRWRRPWVALCIALLLALFVMLVMLVEVLKWLAQANNGQGVIPGFVVGVGLGATIGMLGFHLGHGLAAGLKVDRTTRLMLNYNDALESLAQEPLLQNLTSAPELNCGAQPDYLSRFP